ncbi:hypothetical protein ACFOEE_08420 [Pseudoalteromonas fenneropenaei]|uniref:Uncharacterized protein n=1 Tax=Pseudoalteromonas fenneropenaei TaxID=1737459 RepID=A0ABV7CJ39_9GAMM
MKRFYKHPVKPEWGVTFVDLDECSNEFEEFMFSDIGLKKLKLEIVKAHLVQLSEQELQALDEKTKRKLESYAPAPIFAAKGSVPAKAEKPVKDDDDIEFEDIEIEDSEWMDEEEEIDD